MLFNAFPGFFQIVHCFFHALLAFLIGVGSCSLKVFQLLLGSFMFCLQGFEVLLQSNFDIGFGHLSLGLKFLDLGRPFFELRLVLFLIRFFQAHENFLPKRFLVMFKVSIMLSLSTLSRQICVAGPLEDSR